MIATGGIADARGAAAAFALGASAVQARWYGFRDVGQVGFGSSGCFLFFGLRDLKACGATDSRIGKV